ncbi:MAG: hypothetical protein ACI924_002023 [Flavobacterium sp.]|jgi:hypothetical protein
MLKIAQNSCYISFYLLNIEKDENNFEKKTLHLSKI